MNDQKRGCKGRQNELQYRLHVGDLWSDEVDQLSDELMYKVGSSLGSVAPMVAHLASTIKGTDIARAFDGDPPKTDSVASRQ